MPHIPLICPRCGRPQHVIPGGPDRIAKVVHTDTGREACEGAPEPTQVPPAKPPQG